MLNLKALCNCYIIPEIADNWRANRPFEYEGGQGYVIIFGDSVPGWKRDLDQPEGWEPGCVAVGVNGDLHLATGGNSCDGATAWEQVVGEKQKPTVESVRSAGLSREGIKYAIQIRD